jgi:hypothetical protein
MDHGGHQETRGSTDNSGQDAGGDGGGEVRQQPLGAPTTTGPAAPGDGELSPRLRTAASQGGQQ